MEEAAKEARITFEVAKWVIERYGNPSLHTAREHAVVLKLVLAAHAYLQETLEFPLRVAAL